MREVLTRRFSNYFTENEAKDTPGYKPDLAFSILPDLLIVDGGKGQLRQAMDVLEEISLTGQFTIVGLAKQEEELFCPICLNLYDLMIIPKAITWSNASGMRLIVLPSPRTVTGVVKSG